MIIFSFVEGCYTTLDVPSLKTLVSMEGILSYFIPALFFAPQEIKKMFPLKNLFAELIEETGYFHLQCTKPDTVGK